MTYKLIGRTISTGAKVQVDPTAVGSWEKLADTILALSAKNIDSVDFSEFHSLDYVITMFNDTEELSRRFQVSAIREGAIINSEMFGRIGNLLNVQFNINIVGTTANIEIINNNNFELSVSFVRLTL